MSQLTIAFIQSMNASRARRWHGEAGVMSWSALEWAGAMCGEAGEAANITKKLKRIADKIEGNQYSDHAIDDIAELVPLLGKELADTFFYMVLLAQRVGIDLQSSIVEAFNSKSVEMGFPERL